MPSDRGNDPRRRPSWRGGLSSGQGGELRYDTPMSRGAVNVMKVQGPRRYTSQASGRFMASVENKTGPQPEILHGEELDEEIEGEWLPKHDVYLDTRTLERAKGVVESLSSMSVMERRRRGQAAMLRQIKRRQ